MSTINKASEIAELLTIMLADITVVNGYLTDIGTVTYRGKKNVADDDPLPCVALIEGEDRVADDQGPTQVVLDADYAFVAYLACDPDNPNDAAHLAIKDIKRRMFGEGSEIKKVVKSVKYKGRDIGARADGKAIVMAVVHITIRFAETLADA